MKIKNFGGLVLFCINADFYVQIVISAFFEIYKIKTLCTALNPNFRKILQKRFQFLSNLEEFLVERMIAFNWENV